MRRALKSATAAIAVLAVLVAVFLIVFDWNMLRSALAGRISQETGREFAIDGDLRGSLSLHPWVVARDVRLANPEWAAEPDMLRIAYLAVQLDLRALARGRFVIADLRVRGAEVHLETDDEGRANWDLGGTPDEPDEPPQIPLLENVVIEDSSLTYRDRPRQMELDATIASAAAVSPDEGTLPVSLDGTGRVQGQPFFLKVHGASLLMLRDDEEPYPIEAEVRIGDTEASMTGTVLRPLQPADIDMALHIKGPDASLLAPILHIPLPGTPPYELSGRLVREADIWRFQDFDGIVGDSDLAGSLAVDTGRERPLITADLISKNVEFADLGPLIGLPPDLGAPAEPDGAAPVRVLPDAPLQLEQVQATDAKVTFRGERVVATNLPVHDVELDLDLEEGILRFAPVRFGLAGGSLVLYTSIYSREQPVRTDYDLRLSGIQLQRIVEAAGIDGTGEGILEARAKFSTDGDTIRSAMATARGDAAIIMDRGRIDGSIVGLLDAGFLEALAVVLTDGEPGPMIIRCFVAALDIEDGVMRTGTMILDTEDSLIAGEGEVDLGEETVALRIEGEPKDPGIAHSRVPIELSGTFSSVSVDVDPSELLVRGGLAAGLGALIAPLAAIIPFIDAGLADDSDCLRLMEEARQTVD